MYRDLWSVIALVKVFSQITDLGYCPIKFPNPGYLTCGGFHKNTLKGGGVSTLLSAISIGGV